MTGKGQPSRARIELRPADRRKLVVALENWGSGGELIALRTRALVYLLWDGALRTRPAVALNLEEVLLRARPTPGRPAVGHKTPSRSSRISICREVTMRPCEQNRYRQLRLFTSARTRAALADYVRLLRRQDLIAGPGMSGPLFVSDAGDGPRRISPRTAVHSFRTLLSERAKLSRDYQLDDIVYTGRLAFLRESGGDSDLLGQHADLTGRSLRSYIGQHDLTRSDSGYSPREVLDALYPSA